MFTTEQKRILVQLNIAMKKLAPTLSENGFKDGPDRIEKLLPVNTEQKMLDFGYLLSDLRTAIFERSNGASGMDQGEIVCLSMTSELLGIYRGTFIISKVEIDTTKMFPEDTSDGIRKIELD